MRTVNLVLPENLDINELEIKILLAGELYERERLSLGQAADLVGLSKRAFIEVMGRYGFSLFSQSEEDLLSDIANA
jgi:predicted HTH domain antitoxin